MSKITKFLDILEDVLIFSFFCCVFIWHFLDYNVLRLAQLSMFLAGVTTVKRIRQVDFTGKEGVINRL